MCYKQIGLCAQNTSTVLSSIVYSILPSLKRFNIYHVFFYHVLVCSFCRSYLGELNLKLTFLVLPFAGTFIIQVPYIRSKLQNIICLSRTFKELFKKNSGQWSFEDAICIGICFTVQIDIFPDQVTSSVGRMTQQLEVAVFCCMISAEVSLFIELQNNSRRG